MLKIDIRHNEENEIVKYKFFEEIEHTKDGKDPKTVNQFVNAVHEFEVANGFKDIKKYDRAWAGKFKDYLNDKKNRQTGQNISMSLYFHYIGFVRKFIEWLVANEKDYAHIKQREIDFLNVRKNEKNKARVTNFQESHDIKDILSTIRNMPEATEIEARNKAMLSLGLLTSPRISSLQEARVCCIKHFKDYDAWAFLQDPRLQNTKYSKKITSFFMGKSEDIKQNVFKWRDYLISKGFKDKDFLFPKITPSFTPEGKPVYVLTKEFIKSDSQIRDIVKAAFKSNGLPYRKPHSFRHSISRKIRKEGNAMDRLIALAENVGQKSGMAVIVSSYAGDYLAVQAQIMKNIQFE